MTSVCSSSRHGRCTPGTCMGHAVWHCLVPSWWRLWVPLYLQDWTKWDQESTLKRQCLTRCNYCNMKAKKGRCPKPLFVMFSPWPQRGMGDIVIPPTRCLLRQHTACWPGFTVTPDQTGCSGYVFPDPLCTGFGVWHQHNLQHPRDTTPHLVSWGTATSRRGCLMVYQSWCIQLRGKQGKVRRTLRFSYPWLCKELTGGSGRKGELRGAVRIAAAVWEGEIGQLWRRQRAELANKVPKDEKEALEETF